MGAVHRGDRRDAAVSSSELSMSVAVDQVRVYKRGPKPGDLPPNVPVQVWVEVGACRSLPHSNAPRGDGVDKAVRLARGGHQDAYLDAIGREPRQQIEQVALGAGETVRLEDVQHPRGVVIVRRQGPALIYAPAATPSASLRVPAS